MLQCLLFSTLLFTTVTYGATIAIIDTGFDLDHEFLKPKIFKSETDEEAVDPKLTKKFHGWNFHDNSHLKKAVIEDQSSLQEVLLFRNLRAKGHSEGLSPEEFEWFSNHNSNSDFMEKVKQFKKHAHGTFVAGIALREGKNINIFPIRGLNIPIPVVAVEDSNDGPLMPAKGKTPEEKFEQEIKNSLERVSRKFSKICYYLSLRRIEVVNASYGITYKNILRKFRDIYREHTGEEIDEQKLQIQVNKYFSELYRRGEKTIKRYPKMLFVFSAGNSGLDNDKYHHYPSRIKLPNTIAVAALNGDYLATFSNFGLNNVDIGAPGVAILSLVPKVYSQDGSELYSPSSGTSMAAPYISNLAAQIMNANKKLKTSDVKRVILETGNEKAYLGKKLSSSALVDNQRAIKAARLSKEMPLDEAINLSKLDLIPMEDNTENIKKKILESIPQAIEPKEVDDEPSLTEEELPLPTKSLFSSQKRPVKVQQDMSPSPASAPQDGLVLSADQDLSNLPEEQSPTPSEGPPASSSQSESSLPEVQSPEAGPSLPQL